MATKRKPKTEQMSFKEVSKKIKKIWIDMLSFFSGKDENRKINRSGFWAMLSTISTVFLLLIAYIQLREIKETTNAEFSHKIKNDLYTPRKIRLITLFDADVMQFKTDTNDVIWFELDSVLYRELPSVEQSENIPIKYNIFEVDELLQDFEDLSFYEKKGQISLEYIYDAYAYYIEILWQNPEIKKYISWQRNQAHNGNSYINLEHIYDELKAKTDKEH